jgi:hypothetical protein
MNGKAEQKWDNYLNLSPGESYQIQWDYTYRKSDQASSAHILDRVAPIFASDSCKNTFKNNAEVKHQCEVMTPILCGP